MSVTTPVIAIAPDPATPSHTDNGHVAAGHGHRLPRAADDHHHAPTAPADAAGEVAALRVENANLRAKLASLPVIEQAKGILMSRYQISADAAFNLLCRWSSHTNLKLRDISERLVDAASRVSTATIPTGHAGEEELANLDRLVAAAHDHHARMAATQPCRVDLR